jgi:Tol biopolymer transport system component
MSGPWLWALDVNRKVSRRISLGLERYTSVAASRDGRRIVATVAHPSASLWTAPILDKPATDADLEPYPTNASKPFGPRVAGRALYFLNERGGANGLWRLDSGSTEPIQVWSGFDGGLIEPPAVSPDGGRIAIVLRDGRRRRLVVIASDGTNPRTVSGSIDIYGTPRQSAADWSPDARWLVAGGDDGKGEGLFKIPADGSAPVRLVAGQAQNPIWSPKDDLIIYASAVVEGRATLHAVRSDGTAAPLPAIQAGPGAYRFTPDGKKLVFLPILGAENFRVVDLDSGKESPLTGFSSRGGVTTFDISSDGRHVIFERTTQNSDIVLIERRPALATAAR